MSMKPQVLCLLFAISLLSTTVNSQTHEPAQPHLVGGTLVPVDELEAVGEVIGRGLCTATLIGPRTVLTAAHCVCPLDWRQTGCLKRASFVLHSVRPLDNPTTTLDESAVRQDVLFEGAVRVHPSYESAGFASHDFAILKLDRAASELVNVRPISVEIPSKRPKVGDRLVLVGFGKTGLGCISPPMGKRRVHLPVWEMSTGNVTMRLGQLTMGACVGGSGGPALNDLGNIVGVASTGHPDANYDPTDSAYNLVSGFETLGGDLASGPAVVRLGSDRLKVFIHGKHNDELVQRTWNGTTWSGWKNLGGNLASAPAVVHTGSGRVEVFIRGKDNDELVQRSWNGTTWSGWKNLGGALASAPTVVHTGSGHLEAFIRGKDNDELVQRSWNGTTWSGWKNLGGALASAPTVVHTGSGHLEVFIRGKDRDELVQRSWNGTTWSGWKNLGGALAAAPAALYTGAGRLEVFVRGKDNHELVQRSWNGSSWSGWKNLAGNLAEAPAVVRTASGRLEVFIADDNNHLLRRSLDERDEYPPTEHAATLDLDAASERLDAALKLIDRYHPMASLAQEVLRESSTRRHPVYDFFYAVLARREGAAVLTIDTR